jgi:hypothetical protein
MELSRDCADIARRLGSNVDPRFFSSLERLIVYYCAPCISERMARAINTEAVVGKKFALWRTRRYVRKDSPLDVLVRFMHRGMR